MRPDKGKGKYPLFLPLPYKELSVARTQGMTDAQIRQIALEHVPMPAKGYATIQAALVLQEGLTFDPNGTPYPQHADVVGWSGDEARDRTIAQVLADASTLVDYEGPARTG
ncbi:MAG: hypothetical protein JNN03_05690 [Rubrivivax sp.]|nr:hypothetical protein [Rubrivivax sp.]